MRRHPQRTERIAGVWAEISFGLRFFAICLSSGSAARYIGGLGHPEQTSSVGAGYRHSWIRLQPTQCSQSQKQYPTVSLVIPGVSITARTSGKIAPPARLVNRIIGALIAVMAVRVRYANRAMASGSSLRCRTPAQSGEHSAPREVEEHLRKFSEAAFLL